MKLGVEFWAPKVVALTKLLFSSQGNRDDKGHSAIYFTWYSQKPVGGTCPGEVVKKSPHVTSPTGNCTTKHPALQVIRI